MLNDCSGLGLLDSSDHDLSAGIVHLQRLPNSRLLSRQDEIPATVADSRDIGEFRLWPVDLVGLLRCTNR